MEVEDTVEHRDLEDSTDVGRRDDDMELAAVPGHALLGPEQHPEGHGVEEVALREIDDDVLRTGVAELGQPIT